MIQLNIECYIIWLIFIVLPTVLFLFSTPSTGEPRSVTNYPRQLGLARPFEFAVSKAWGPDFGGMLNAKNEQIMTNAVEYVVQ